MAFVVDSGSAITEIPDAYARILCTQGYLALSPRLDVYNTPYENWRRFLDRIRKVVAIKCETSYIVKDAAYLIYRLGDGEGTCNVYDLDGNRIHYLADRGYHWKYMTDSFSEKTNRLAESNDRPW